MGIRNIIAMSPDGIPYFSASYMCQTGKNCDALSKEKGIDNKDPMLISGFFTVVRNMALSGGGDIQQISFDKFKYIADAAPKLILLMSIGIDDDLEDYKNRLQICIDIFLKNFGENLKKWHGETNLFNGYQMMLEESGIFEHEPEFRKNCINCEFNKDCTFRMITGHQNLEIKDKIKEIGGMNFMKKFMTMMTEMMKYAKQKKRYYEFNRKIKELKEEEPEQDILELILREIRDISSKKEIMV